MLASMEEFHALLLAEAEICSMMTWLAFHDLQQQLQDRVMQEGLLAHLLASINHVDEM